MRNWFIGFISRNNKSSYFLIHEADLSHSGSEVITIFTRTVITSVTFQNIAKLNKFQVKVMIATGVIVGLAEWIIDCASSYFSS